MVSRLENNSFFGLPPAPVALKTISTPSVTELANFQAHPISPIVILDEDDAVCVPGDTETSQEVRGQGQGANNSANTSCRRPASFEHTQNGSPNTRISESTAWEADEKAWQVWHEQELPGIFAQWTPRVNARSMVCK